MATAGLQTLPGELLRHRASIPGKQVMHRCHCSCCCIRGQVTVIDRIPGLHEAEASVAVVSNVWWSTHRRQTAKLQRLNKNRTCSPTLEPSLVLIPASHKPLQSKFPLLLSVLMIQNGCCADVHPSTGHQSITACLLVSPLTCSLPQ